MKVHKFTSAVAESVARDARRADDGTVLHYRNCVVDAAWTKESLLDLARYIGHQLATMKKEELERFGI